MEGIVKDIKEEKILVIVGEDEKDYEIENKEGFIVGDILSFDVKDGNIDPESVKKVGHLNLENLDPFQTDACANCSKCCF